MKINLLLFILAILLASCQILNDSEIEDIEADLLGEWFQIEKRELDQPSPVHVYHGWSIKSDGTMNRLGVDGRTGEISLVEIETSFSNRIESARDGKMLVVETSPFGVSKDTIAYSINGDTLSLVGNSLQGTFNRTKMGKVVTSSPMADFSIKIDGTGTEIRKVDNWLPTAYISKISDSEVIIHSNLSDKRHRITVIIDEYEGSGTYNIDVNQGQYLLISGNEAHSYVTRSDSSGTVMISCDNSESRCSGELWFNAYLPGAPEEPEYMKVFSNGSFDLPVYK